MTHLRGGQGGAIGIGAEPDAMATPLITGLVTGEGKALMS